MEVIVLLVGINVLEVFLAGYGGSIFDILEYYMVELLFIEGVRLNRTQYAMTEHVGCVDIIVEVTHDDIISIASHERVVNVELIERVVLLVAVVGKPQGNSSVGVERIELCYGTVTEHCSTAEERSAIVQRVGYLAVPKVDNAVGFDESVALTVVDCRVVCFELQPLDVRRVAHHTVVSGMDVGVAQAVLVRRLIEVDALPLSRNTVLRQVAEHVVDTVATESDVGIG